MSRIGKQPIPLGDKAKVVFASGMLNVEGPIGKLSRSIPDEISIEITDKEILVKRNGDENHQRAIHGLFRSLINNMVVGVTDGFKKELDIVGVGYRVEQNGQTLVFNLGYSHPIEFKLPKAIQAKVEGRKNELVLTSYDKELLGLVSAKIRSFRPPEPYKGKGVKYRDEVISRKVGKAGGK